MSSLTVLFWFAFSAFHVAADTLSKKVVLIGPTGVGKSFVGNKLLGKMSGGNAFTSKASPWSVTNVSKSASNEVKFGEDCRDLICSNGSTMHLTVIDTPGLGDTGGRSLAFIDDIMDLIKGERPDAIVLVVHGAERMMITQQLALTAFAACFGETLQQNRVFLLANKASGVASLAGDGGFDVDDEAKAARLLTEITNEWRVVVNEAMMTRGTNQEILTIFPNSIDKNGEAGLPPLINAIGKLPPSKWNLEHAMKFTDRLEETVKLLSDKNLLLKDVAKNKQILEEKLASTESDRDWYKQEMATYRIATDHAGVGVGVSAGMVSVALTGAVNPVVGLVYVGSYLGGWMAQEMRGPRLQQAESLVQKYKADLAAASNTEAESERLRKYYVSTLKLLIRLGEELQQTAQQDAKTGTNAFDNLKSAYNAIKASKNEI